jgi:hypothetical protein
VRQVKLAHLVGRQQRDCGLHVTVPD